MARAPAHATITAINTESVEEPGRPVDVSVTIRDDAGGTAAGETHNLAWVEVTSSAHSQVVIRKCIVIQPGDTTTVDDSSLDIGLDGEFDMPSSDVTLSYEAGGVHEDDLDSVGGCENAGSVATITDTAQQTVASVNPEAVSVVSCAGAGGGVDQPATLSATVENPESAAVSVEVEWVVDGQYTFSDRYDIPPGSHTVEITASPPSGGWPVGDLPIAVNLNYPSIA